MPNNKQDKSFRYLIHRIVNFQNFEKLWNLPIHLYNANFFKVFVIQLFHSVIKLLSRPFSNVILTV